MASRRAWRLSDRGRACCESHFRNLERCESGFRNASGHAPAAISHLLVVRVKAPFPRLVTQNHGRGKGAFTRFTAGARGSPPPSRRPAVRRRRGSGLRRRRVPP
ncbi:hypothetical protein DL990_00960 [Amycolatopsis sp. WAC 01416]|nr:hypothetical protein DL990_00960 [Amycolatopsis sp. WAC 01416]